MMARTESKRPATSGTRRGHGAGIGGPANGPGWGGPAKGASQKRERAALVKAGPGRGHFSIVGAARRERKEVLAEQLCELLYGIALDPQQPAILRVNAAAALLNRIEGLPRAMVNDLGSRRHFADDRRKNSPPRARVSKQS